MSGSRTEASGQMASQPARAQELQHRALRWQTGVVIGLIVLVGFNLRSVILSVPPILPLIQHDLGLSYTMTGLLTSLPILFFGGLAWPIGILVERVGSRGTVTTGLALLAVGAALRGVWPAAVPLFLFTAMLSTGIALAQTAVPVFISHRFPLRIGLVAALFTDGLILGEAVSAATTVPLLQSVLGPTAWTRSFLFWSAPVVLTLVLWVLLAPSDDLRGGRRARAERTLAGVPETPRAKPHVSAWHLGVLLGAGSLIYFGMNGWIASYNLALGRGGQTALALGILNAAQLPVSLTATVFAQQLAGRRAPFVVTGALAGLAVIGWVVTPAALEPLWAAVLGGCSALVFLLGIALPALLARRDEVARLTGATLGVSYGVAFLGPLLGGALWDHLHLPWTAFVPVLAAAIALVVLGALLPAAAREHTSTRD